MQIIEQNIGEMKRTSPAAHGNCRLSSFCIASENEDGVLLCQTATGGMVLLSREEYERVKNPTFLTEPWMEKLADLQYLREIGTDEYAQVDERRRRYYESSEAKGCITDFTILPTSRCNARCFYCYEQGIPQKNMSRETAQSVADYIIRVSGGKKVRLGWFGGEPTLGADIISLICQRLRENGVSYTSGIISNGLLLDDGMIHRAAEEWNLKHIQITLDGTEPVYQQVKNYKGNPVSPFRTVLEHIDAMLAQKLHVSIRINLGLHNVDDVRELITQLDRHFPERKYLTVYVHQIDNYYAVEDHIQLMEWTEALNRRLVKRSLQKLPGLPQLRDHSCMADRADSVVINPDGQLGKCEHYVFEKLHGTIHSEEQDKQLCSAWRETVRFPHCSSCPLYASCLRLKWCNGGEFDCTEEMAAQKIRVTQELMCSHYLKWLQNRQSFREKWFVLTVPYTLLHTQNGAKAIFQTQGGESIPVNQTSVEILEILQKGAFFQDIVCELEERYCAEPEQIQDAVASYLRELLELRICKYESGELCKE